MSEAELRSTYHLSFNEWMSWNLRMKNSSNKAEVWRDKFAIYIGWIWHWRNKLIFENLEPDTRAKESTAPDGWAGRGIRNVESYDREGRTRSLLHPMGGLVLSTARVDDPKLRWVRQTRA